MNPMTQGSNDMRGSKPNKSDKSRRIWSSREEEILLAALKELVAHGWKSDNGFRAGYLNKLEEAMKKEFPGTDIKGIPNISSKLTTWKKNYYSLQSIMNRSGVGFNVKGDHMIDCDNDQWEQIVKIDNNARVMRYKSWPFLEDWKEIFGKDRATGVSADDVLESLNDSYNEDNLENVGIGNDNHVNLEELYTNNGAEDSVCQSEKDNQLPRHRGKKRKVVDEMLGFFELLCEMHQDTNARLENLSTRIGYEVDLGKARKEVFDLSGNIPGLSLDDKLDACEILADKVERLEIFMGLPDVARERYVMRLLNRVS